MAEEFTDTEAFGAAFNEKAASSVKFIAIFTGSIDAATNESWCPDCVDAKPYIQRITDLCVERGRPVIKGIVTREEWRGNAAHPYRHHPYNAGGVPTMVLFDGSNALFKIDEQAQFADEGFMNMFLDE